MGTVIELINRAIKEDKRLFIIYSENSNQSNRTIKPIKWSTSDHLLAYDFLLQREIKISRAAIRRCRIMDNDADIDDVASSQFDSALASNLHIGEDISQELTTMNNSIKELIEQAIQQQSELLLKFDAGGIRMEVVRPLHWTNTGELCALVIEGNYQIFVKPGFILTCEPYHPSEKTSSRQTNRVFQEVPIQSPLKPVSSKTDFVSTLQAQSTTAPTSAPRLSRKQPAQVAKPIEGIEAIESFEEWRRLLNFYRECLVHENFQEYIIDQSKDRIQFFDVSQEHLESFLAGQSYLLFHQGKNKELFKFVTSIQRRNNQQLYIGFPIFVADTSKLAPVLIAPVNATPDNDQVRLETDGYEVSYAALASLGLRDEEIISVLTSISDSISQKGQITIPALVDTIINLTGELLGEDLNRLKSNSGTLILNTFEYRPCLFWANPGIATANLIKELDTLGAYWSLTPQALRYLLNVVPEYEYPEAPTEAKDRNIYVAPVYERQRQAIAAALARPLTVVTGPPGTGKSQFILNLIVQAVMRGEKVLFASRNNKAVNVVMDRLQGDEIGFPGAIRTGNKDERRKAIHQIDIRLRELSAHERNPEDMDELLDRYWQFQTQYLRKLSILKEVRLKTGLLTSRTTELNDLRKLIPAEMLSSVEKMSFSFSTDEYEYLLSSLATQRAEGLELKSDLEMLADEIAGQFDRDKSALPLIAYLNNYEDQWGSVRADLLQPDNLETIQRIQVFMSLWSDFLDAVENQILLNMFSASFRELKAELEKQEVSLDESELAEARNLSQAKQFAELLACRDKSKSCLNKIQALLKQRRNLWIRLLALLGVKNPIRDISIQLSDLQKSIQIQMPVPERTSWRDLEELSHITTAFSRIFEAAYLISQVAQAKENLAEARQATDMATIKLPKSLAENIKKLSPTQEEITETRKGIFQITSQVGDLTKKIDKLKLEIQKKLDENSDELEFLRALHNTDKKRILAISDKLVSPEPDALIDFLSSWRSILSFWKTQDVITGLQRELKLMSTEDTLVLETRELGEALFKLGGKILTEKWKKNSRSLDANTFQKANQYVSAAKQLLEGGLSTSYAQVKGMEEDALPSVMQLFPVWATTNLSAKSNFPLTPGLFDLVIIDEASQCDLPSALPLLYRANRVVIVGDVEQLRHIARVLPNTEEEAARKHGISQVLYSYAKHSLFDIAYRSVQPKPSTILLNEHYRSDPQIFGFSKEEYYSEELKIYTDITRFSLPTDYIKDGTGVFWVDIPGIAHHPSGGSAFNDSELKTISELIPKLLNDLKRRKLNNLNLGVISPYREQEKRILSWLDGYQKDNSNLQGHITVGTSHKFQGDERDIVIFSPVLAQGIKDGSQKWLDDTSNLLNVAISRARITMIVVGDWKYCLSLSKDSKYRKLAEYVARHPNRVVNSIDTLPIFKGLPLDIIGVLLDRHNRQRNRLTLQKLLLACDQYIWWMDPFISNSVFDLLIDISKHPEFKLNDIRILTSREQTWAERNPINPKLVKNVRNEFAKNGISIQLGLLPKHEIPHDRYFYSAGYAINMPPFGGAYGEHKMVSEYTESKTKNEFFESYWSRADKF